MSVKPHVSRTAFLVAHEAAIHRPPTMNVVVPHGERGRRVEIELTRTDLLVIIANAADALRLMEENA